MQSFEYFFNPHLRKDTQLNVFSLRPENPDKKHLGNLYLIVEYSNSLIKNNSILEELIHTIKEEFYSRKKLPEENLTKALKKGNEFLNKQANSGDVSWLGNLNIVVLNINNNYLHFSKSGNMKILMLRGDELTNIAEDMEIKETGTSFKFFPNIASGLLAANDKIMVLNQELFEDFYDKILSELINIPEINNKNIRKFFKEKRKETKKFFGVFFLISITKKKFSFNLDIPLSNFSKLLILLLIFLTLILISILIFRG